MLPPSINKVYKTEFNVISTKQTEERQQKKESRQQGETRYYGVDVFRLAGAFSVIVLHISFKGFPEDMIVYARLIARWAVPFFFIVSGFFFHFRYCREGLNAFSKTIKNLVIITLIANGIYFFEKLFTGDIDEISSNSFLYRGFSFHLWFLNSLITSYLALWFFYYKKLQRFLIPVSFFLMVVILVLGNYSRVFHIENHSIFSRHLSSFPLIILGLYLARTQFIQRTISWKLGLCLTLLGIGIQILEAKAIYSLSNYALKNHDFSIGTIIYAFGAFALAVKIPLNKDTLLSEYGRRYSLAIYLYHPFVIILFLSVLEMFALKNATVVILVLPVILILINLLFVLFIDKKFPKLFRLMNGAL